MNAKRSPAKLLVGLLKDGVIAFLVLLLCLVLGHLAGFTPTHYILNQLRVPEFARRRFQWESLEITHYLITVNAISPMAVLCPTATLEFQDGRLVDFQPVDWPMSEDELWPSCPDYYEYQSIERLFDTAAEVLYGDSIFDARLIELEFDRQFGYPTLIRVTGQMSEQPNFIVLDFQALE